MTVPETPVDEDDLSSRTEDEVWPSRQVCLMEPIAVSQPMDKSSDEQLRFCVLRANQTHLLAAFESA
jgi:hypothetical protein